MSRLDYLKSLLRSGPDAARERAGESNPAGSMRRMMRELRSQGATLTEAQVTRWLASADGAGLVRATARRGWLQVHASFDRQPPLDCEIRVDAIRFAPRGAKELVFQITPAEASRHPKARAIAANLAGVVAHGLWAMVLGPPPDDVGGAIVDRDGEGLLRVDLRTVPAVREAMKRGAGALVIDTLSLSAVTADEGEFRIAFQLPGLLR